MDATKAVTATFAVKTNTITVTVGAEGSISPSGSISVNYGGSQAFTITPVAPYHIANIIVDGTSVGISNPYILTNITSSHSIDVSFALDVPAVITIIDNGSPGTSSSGTWYVSGGYNSYGVDSFFSRNGTYTWVYIPNSTGNYELYAWWSCYPSRSKNVPVDIEYSGGTKRLIIDQSQNCGMWYYLGLYPLIVDTSYRTTITAKGRLTTCIDAMKFVLKP
jgi:hypothetical protein